MPPLIGYYSISCAIVFCFSIYFANAQGGQPMWRLDGNSVATGKFLGTTNNEPLIFKSNNTEGFRLLPDGSIGIGTTAPQAKLDVNGDVVVRGWLWAQDGVVVGKRFQGGKADVDTMRAHQTESDRIMSHFVYIDGSLSRISSTSGFIDFNNASLTNINHLSAETFNIGNLQADSMTVAGILKIGNTIYLNGAVPPDAQNTIPNRDEISITNPVLAIGRHVGSTQNDFADIWFGLGTQNPQVNFHIKGRTCVGPNCAAISPPGGEASTVLRIEDQLWGSAADSHWWDFVVDAKTGKLGFVTQTDQPPNYKRTMTMTKEGFVGIGTSNPESKLQVFETGQNAIAVIAGDTTAKSIFLVPNIGGWGYNPMSRDGDVGIIFRNGNQNQGNAGLVIAPHNSTDNMARGIRISPEGNVGIGTGDPEYRLDVVANYNGLRVKTNHSLEYGYCILAEVNLNKTKSIVVRNSGMENFIVYGNGDVFARRVKVTLDSFADFVFHDDYILEPIEHIKDFISANGHLPDIPKEEYVLENGIEIGEFSTLLLKKIEELYLYLIIQNERIKELELLLENQ